MASLTAKDLTMEFSSGGYRSVPSTTSASVPMTANWWSCWDRQDAARPPSSPAWPAC